MRYMDYLRGALFLTVAIPLYSPAFAAECQQPELPSSRWTQSAPASNEALWREFQSRVYEFIDCQRSSLQKRAGGLEPAAVRDLIVRDRAAEDQALAELASVIGCLRYSEQESDPQAARAGCEQLIKWELRDRRQGDTTSEYRELASAERTAYGGVWSYRTLDFGRPGVCMDGPCDHMVGVEVTNMTPSVLTCEVALHASSSDREGTHYKEQVITLNPGDSLPAARLTTVTSAWGIEPTVTCAPAPPLPVSARVPSECTVHWAPRSAEFPIGFSRRWTSGVALLEFAVPNGRGPASAIRTVHSDSAFISDGAAAVIKELSMTTNCPQQRFRIRVEFRPFASFPRSFGSGVVTVYRDG